MRVTVDTAVQIPMRDGIRLVATVWRSPDDEPVPALLMRTPYGKDSADLLGNPKLADVLALVEAGYSVLVQDVRGTGGSEGEFIPHDADADDGLDTLAWLTDQSWCDGRIGTWGGSYMGIAQWQAAVHDPEALRGMVSVMASGDPYRAPWYSPGGGLSLETFLTWAVRVCALNLSRSDDEESHRTAAELIGQMADTPALLSQTPIAEHPILRQHFRWFSTALDDPTGRGYWQQLAALERAGDITVPALNVGGWYDPFVTETVRAYTTMREHGGSEEARTGQRLIIGPWSHPDGADLGRYPDRSFGAASSIKEFDLTSAHLRFFDRWVRGRQDDAEDPPVQIFVMGIDEWREEEAWPLADTVYTDYHLSSSGRAHTAAGDGLLSTDPPGRDGEDVYTYDPRRPVPTLGGTTLATGPDAFPGPADQSPVEARDDVLCYTTPELERAIEVTGHVKLTLSVSSSAVDTDFCGKLVDVHPDGRAIILCEGFQRARYRESLAEPKLMRPGEVYEVVIDLAPTANVFLAGHRIRLEVSSSNFPRYDRNSNTGGNHPYVPEGDMVEAVNHVHHGPAHPSRLTLPVIDR
jgi:putative CocE/NonD family hydrolase